MVKIEKKGLNVMTETTEDFKLINPVLAHIRCPFCPKILNTPPITSSTELLEKIHVSGWTNTADYGILCKDCARDPVEAKIQCKDPRELNDPRTAVFTAYIAYDEKQCSSCDNVSLGKFALIGKNIENERLEINLCQSCYEKAIDICLNQVFTVEQKQKEEAKFMKMAYSALRKRLQWKSSGYSPNGKCACGSGKKAKKCCKGII